MRELTLKKNKGFFTGLLWRFTTTYGDMPTHDDGTHNVCSIVSYFFRALFGAALVIVISVIFFFPFAQLFVWAGAMAQHSVWIAPSKILVASWALVFILCCIALLIYVIEKINKLSKKMHTALDNGDPEQSLSVAAYMAVKRKTCVKVVFK